MANREHLDILKQGVKIWNQWRKEHSDIRPDLRWADLRRANLSWIDLSSTDLRWAILSRANSSEADLSEANLGEANLSQANLSQANLSKTSFSGAILSRAILTGANLNNTDLSRTILDEADLSNTTLIGVNLREAILRNTTLSNAEVGYAIFGNVDLRGVKGLELMRHHGPSTIGIDTITRSQGKIPEIFLRNAGVPRSIIEAIPFLISSLKPIDFYSCFISYSDKDSAFAERFHADLQAKGVNCWFAPEDLKIGAKIRPSIDESIHLYDKLLLVLSQHSVASQWVEQEVETALAKERKERRIVLFPIRLDNAVMGIEGGWPALIRNTRNIGNFERWKRHDTYQKAFDRLLRDLKAES